MFLAGALLATGLAASTNAAVITYATSAANQPLATTSGGNVNATAIITTGTNSVEVVLQNFQADPVSVAQAISALQFTLSTGQTSASLFSTSGIDRDIHSDGTYTDGTTLTSRAHWGVGAAGAAINLDDLLGNGQPDELIIGPPLTSADASKNNRYFDAGGSISGNGPHNPFTTGLSSDFVLTVNGVTPATTVTNAQFQFGTTEGSNRVTGVAVATPPDSTPEPSSMALFALAGAGLLRRRQSR
jgi:MYXO-CTERM domain-containing protein